MNDNIDETANPPILHLPCENIGDNPYIWANEGMMNNKHYIYIGLFVGTDDYLYYCPEDDAYQKFSVELICKTFKRYNKYAKFEFYKNFN